MKKENKKKIALPIVLGVAGLLFLIIICGAVFLVRRIKGGAGDGNDLNNKYKSGVSYKPEDSYKSEVSYKDETYTNIYNYIKDYEDYLNEQAKVGSEAEDFSESSDGAAVNVPTFTDTNVRTEGVIEPDVVKTDGEYIYRTSTDGRTLFTYRVKDGEIEKLSEKKILEDYYYFKDLCIYGDKIVALGTYNAPTGNYGLTNDELAYSYNPYSKTFITFIDISDKSEPVVEKILYQSGDYYSSRIIDGVIYTFSLYSVEPYILEQKKLETYIPAVDGEILCPEDLAAYKKSNYFYLVASSVNADEQSVVDKLALFGGSSTPYVSENAIYDTVWKWGSDADTTLVKITMDAGKLDFACDGTFPGELLNDYSIDEYKGNLRLVTSYFNEKGERRNGLYVLDSNLNKVSVIKALAPDETIRSARFMGNIAYFVTYRVQDYFYDPLFAIDLSDPENPKITDYMKLPGFSGYLHPYGENKLLGIGYDTDEETGIMNCVKFSMFDTTDPFDIKEEATCNFRPCQSINVLGDRNSFMYNPADGTFGTGVTISRGTIYYAEKNNDSDDWYTPEKNTHKNDDGVLIQDEGPILPEGASFNDYGFSYLVMDYEEGKGFTVKLNYDLGKNTSPYEFRQSRGIVIGDYIYIVDPHNGIESFDTENYKLVDASK